jgi:hypothetical protein
MTETLVRRLLKAGVVLNLAAVWLLLKKGKNVALEYLTQSSRYFQGFGFWWRWHELPWRDYYLVPKAPAGSIFPGIDFDRSLELYFPFPRDQGVYTHELAVLTHVVNWLKPRRVIEFGTAEGRTAVNLAAYLPVDGEVVTIDIPPVPPADTLGNLHRDHPLKPRIKQLYGDLLRFDWSSYRNSAAVVFCDALDQYEGAKKETKIAFELVETGGTIFWHDYGYVEGVTRLLNELSRGLPVRHIEGTTLGCLSVPTEEIREQLGRWASSESTSR